MRPTSPGVQAFSSKRSVDWSGKYLEILYADTAAGVQAGQWGPAGYNCQFFLAPRVCAPTCEVMPPTSRQVPNRRRRHHRTHRRCQSVSSVKVTVTVSPLLIFTVATCGW